MTLVNAETGEVVPTLSDLEQTIERGLSTFVDVGNALLAIRDGKLYRADHDTFETYCVGRWGLKRQRAYELIASAEVATAVSEISDIQVARESHAAALAPLLEQPEAMAEVMEEVAAEGPVTAAAIAAKVADKVIDSRAAAVAKYPWLDVPATTQQIVNTAIALDKYTGAERTERIETSKKWASSMVRKKAEPAPAIDRSALLAQIGKAYDALLVFNLAATKAGFVLKDHPDLVDDDDADWVGAIASARNHLDDLTPVPKKLRVVR